MMADQLTARLGEYDAWRAPVPDGWFAMDDARHLRMGPLEYLYADGSVDTVPVTSNADWLCSGLKPVAWRAVVSPKVDKMLRDCALMSSRPRKDAR